MVLRQETPGVGKPASEEAGQNGARRDAEEGAAGRRPSGSGDAEPPPATPQPPTEEDSRGFLGVLAKWFLPSATAIFIVVGFLATTAQHQLIGLADPPIEGIRYVLSAADFFGSVVTILSQWFVEWAHGRPVSFAGHGLLLAGATVLAAASIFVPPRSGRLRRRHSFFLAATLLVVLGVKFLSFDAPLAQVDHLVLARADVPRPVGDTLQSGDAKTFVDRLRAQDASGRVRELTAAIVCSRIGAGAVRASGASDAAALCRDEDQARYQSDANGEFAAQLWAAALIAWLALALLRASRSSLPATLAMLGLAYLLTLPYAFGKLEKSTYFDYGLIRVAESLSKVAGQEATTRRYGLIIDRSPTGARLLEISPIPCSNDPKNSAALVTVSAISPTQILSIEQIYRQDVLTWAILNRRNCPAIATRSPIAGAADWKPPSTSPPATTPETKP